MRRIILDLEATGNRDTKYQRICEIGAIEFDEHYLPVSYYQQHINPVVRIPFSGYKIHKLTNGFLSHSPRFHVIADSFIEYLRGAQIYAHGARNDRNWLDSELARYLLPTTEALDCTWIDTLKIAQKHTEIPRPGIDGLCDWYGMDTSFRLTHGALTDCALLLSILPLIEGHEDQGWEPEDISDWLDKHPELNHKKQFTPPPQPTGEQLSLQIG